VRRRLIERQEGAAEQSARAEVESLVASANREPGMLPTGPVLPSLPKHRMQRVVEKIFDIDIDKAYAELEGKLWIDNALTPQAIRAALNTCEKYALLAHQLYVAAKDQSDAYARDADPVIGAMRKQATEALARDKAGGRTAKQVTEEDVRLKMASLFPDEYREIFGRKDRLKHAVTYLERHSDLWKNRTFSLTSLNNK